MPQTLKRILLVSDEWREVLSLSDYRSRVHYFNALFLGELDMGMNMNIPYLTFSFFLFNCVLSVAAYSDCAVQSLTHRHMLLVTCSTRDVDPALQYELETTAKLAAASALTCLIFT
jgi:hypothetical protein